LIEREGVMGLVPLISFLDWNWRDHGGRQAIGLEKYIAQIDHVCQLAGNARHVAIGTDFDGGFGVEAVPHEIDTIADLPKLIPLLEEKGYNQSDIDCIMHGNWLRILTNNLPTS
jgi:membrane dipeptidase